MSGNLGDLTAYGIQSTTNKIVSGGWVVTFPQQSLPSNEEFEMWHAAALGPGGYFRVYLDEKLFGIGENGLFNEYSPKGSAMLIRRGQAISMHWSLTTGTRPQVWIYLRLPEVGKL